MTTRARQSVSAASSTRGEERTWVRLPGGAYWIRGGSSTAEHPTRRESGKARKTQVRLLVAPNMFLWRGSSESASGGNGPNLLLARVGLEQRGCLPAAPPRKELYAGPSKTEVRSLPSSSSQAGVAQSAERCGLRSPEVGGSIPSARIFVCGRVVQVEDVAP